MKRGRFAQLHQMAKEQKEKFSGDFTRKLILKDGETAILWFPGTSDAEPHIIRRHYDPVNKYYYYCGGKQCVACYQAGKGNKSFKKGTPISLFTTIDERWFHKVQSKEDPQKHKYILCSEDASCKGCARKIERVRSGKRLAELALQWGDALGVQEDKISKKCASCHTGRIKVVEYLCPECGEVLDWTPDPENPDEEATIKCGGCHKKVHPAESIECTNCDKPKRGTIFECGCPVEVTRSGEKTGTAYNFTPIWPPPEAPEWLFEKGMEPFDMEEIVKKETMDAAAMSEKFGLVNPFSGKERRQAEEIASDDPFDDEDLNETNNDPDTDDTPSSESAEEMF